jgi:hypothetical protein
MRQRRTPSSGELDKGTAKNSPPNPIAKNNRVLQHILPESGQIANVSVRPLCANPHPPGYLKFTPYSAHLEAAHFKKMVKSLKPVQTVPVMLGAKAR